MMDWILPITPLFPDWVWPLNVGMRADYTWLTKFIAHGLAGLYFGVKYKPIAAFEVAVVSIFMLEFEQALQSRWNPESYFGIGDFLFGCLGGVVISLCLWLINKTRKQK